MFSVFNFLSCNGEQLSVLPRHLKNCLCSSSISNCPRTMMMHVTGMVDCFRCVCILKTHRQSTLCFTTHVYLCSCIILCYFTGIFYAVIRQITVLFTDNKDSVFCIHQLLINPAKRLLSTWWYTEEHSEASVYWHTVRGCSHRPQ